MARSASPLPRPSRLAFETLEKREVMTAGLSAVLSGGVLSIVDTKSNDAIVLQQRSGMISIQGLSGTFASSMVNRISIDTSKGNDSIRLDCQNFAGGSPLRVGVTVTTHGGSDAIIGPAGTNLFVAGSNQVTYDPNGTVRLNGAAPDWFDTHVQDAALRTLGQLYFRDGLIDRNDMIGLLHQVENEGPVSATNFQDLKTIVGNGSLFGSLNYVQVLASDIVNGNPANARYQGRALGNLGVGSSVTQLDTLVSKWFYGTDHPLGQSAWGPVYAYRQASGTLFGSGVSYTDVAQGGLGDCYFLSALGEVALKNPSQITSMFIVNGDGTYTVRFYNNGRADYVTVDSQLPTDSAGRFVFANNGALASNPGNKLWVALAEKAYVQVNEEGWLRAGISGNGQNAYIAVQGGWIADALKQITGHSAQAFNTTGGANSFNNFVNAFNKGEMIGFASNASPTLSSVVGGHAYAVVSYNATNKTITLFNPWGINNGTNKPGLITLTWSQIQANFGYWDMAA